MSIKLKYTKFDLLLNPPANSVLFGIDESTGDVMIKNSRGELEKIQKVPTGGGAVGESVVIGSISGATTGIKYLANGLDVSPTGDYTQASGNKTIASGLYSHASGKWTIASGVASFSGGIGRTVGYEVVASNSGSCNFSRALTQPSDAAGIASAILGGTDNTITYTGENSVILGGSLNELYAPNGAIIGGTDNGVSALATNGIVIGGLNNDVTDTAINSVIIGCSYITASTPNSVYVPNVILTSPTNITEEGALFYDGDHFYGRNGSGYVDLETPVGYNNVHWDTAYSWGNHALAGYLTSVTAHASTHVTGSDQIATFNSTSRGLVPASGGGTSNFLRADGSFAAPSISWSSISSKPTTVDGYGITDTVVKSGHTDTYGIYSYVTHFTTMPNGLGYGSSSLNASGTKTISLNRILAPFGQSFTIDSYSGWAFWMVAATHVTALSKDGEMFTTTKGSVSGGAFTLLSYPGIPSGTISIQVNQTNGSSSLLYISMTNSSSSTYIVSVSMTIQYVRYFILG